MELIVKNPEPPRLSVGMSVWLWDDLRQDVSFGTVKCLSEFTPVRDGKPSRRPGETWSSNINAG